MTEAEFIDPSPSTQDIERLCRQLSIEKFTVNTDGTVDVDKTVNLSHRVLKQLPIQFGKVTGDFLCNNNRLTTLAGIPKQVGGFIRCTENPDLKPLEMVALLKVDFIPIKYQIDNQQLVFTDFNQIDKIFVDYLTGSRANSDKLTALNALKKLAGNQGD